MLVTNEREGERARPGRDDIRLDAIAREMEMLGIKATTFEWNYHAASGIVDEQFQTAWDAAIASLWDLADEASTLSVNTNLGLRARARIDAGLQRMLSTDDLDPDEDLTYTLAKRGLH